MNLAEVIQRSTRALQPVATTVPAGTLYFVTDETITERSNGTAWESISDGGGAEGTSDWDTEIIKSGDQSITNSATLVDVALFTQAVLINETWLFEFLIAYSGDSATADIQWALNSSVGTMMGCAAQAGLSTANAAMVAGVAFNASANAGGANGTDAVDGVRPLWVRAILTFSASCNLTFQFAQNTITAAKTVKIRTGSIMRSKKIV